ncbi:hypothetical protein [Acaryochloris sp. 'Moss Beach']|uniref:hypothetical protein n=1 Tax=Acaryochloris sp. 'Moss Beach' TaxID=2740837 RepID=UPI001F1AB786|nr:hypothetical protein [Acaryochloris sp. 'Moss Beach']
MTACLLAQNLLYNGNSLTKAYDNPLYNAWVKEVDIVKLLDFNSNEDDQKKSLLNIKVVEDIANKYLLDEKKLELKSKENSGILHKHPAVSSEVKIGVAMSNLSGFSYNIKTKTQQKFGYTRYKDQFICSIKKTGKGEQSELLEKQLNENNLWIDAEPTTWSDIRNAGISSGAFPLAFPLRSIKRKGFGKFAERDSKKKQKKLSKIHP